MRNVLLKRFFKCIIPLLLFSCTLAKPEIKEIKWDIKYINDLEIGLNYESLSLFVKVYDDDGVDDIKNIFIIDDKSGIRWELDESNWIMEELEGSAWFGSTSIVMPDRSDIPKNSLRVFIRDRAGESIEDKVYITKPTKELDKLDYPLLKIESGNFILNNYERASILAFSNIGEHLYTGELSKEVKSFEEIFSENRRSQEELLYYLIIKDNGNILESGPWRE